MERIFLQVFFVGISASWLILAILLLRYMFSRAPKWIACLLWMFLGLRLVCPFSIESSYSLIPKQFTALLERRIGYFQEGRDLYIENKGQSVNSVHINDGTNAGQAGESHSNQYVSAAGVNNNVLDSGIRDRDEQTANAADEDMISGRLLDNRQIVTVFEVIWGAGGMLMLLYLFKSMFKLRSMVRTATRFSESEGRHEDNSSLYNRVWQSEFVDSPFIMGIFNPKIYVPYHMEKRQLDFALAHEYAHLKRKDQYVKMLAYLLLAVYWFNPLVWVSYLLLCRDIELACDERVIKSMKAEERKGYLMALLSISTDAAATSICPLAFGKVGIKERIKRVKQYKRLPMWLIIAAVAVCTIGAVGFMANPRVDKETVQQKSEENADKEDDKGQDSVKISVRHADVDLTENSGADGVIPYYIDENKIIFGGYFGIFTYDRQQRSIVDSLDLKYIGCNYTQGDYYCDIRACEDGSTVYMQLNKDDGYTLFTYKPELPEIQKASLTRENRKESIYDSPELSLFKLDLNYDVGGYEYVQNGEKRCLIIRETNRIIGDCTFADFPMKEETGIVVYNHLFPPKNYRFSKELIPEDMHDIYKIEMRIRGVMEEITDRDTLLEVEKYFKINKCMRVQNVESGCPIYNPMYVTFKSGDVGVIWPATDSCNIFMSDRGYYKVGDGDNSHFWKLLGDWYNKINME